MQRSKGVNPMGKICKKCGYERKLEDSAPDYECPKCGAVYAKVEASLEREQERAGYTKAEISKLRKVEALKRKTARIGTRPTEGSGFWRESKAGVRRILSAAEPRLRMILSVTKSGARRILSRLEARLRGISSRFTQILTSPVETPSSPIDADTRLYENSEFSARTRESRLQGEKPVTASQETRSMDDKWYYSRGGKQAGPISASEIKQLAASGQLLPTDMLWKDGMPEWVHAARFKGLYLDISNSGPPPLPTASTGAFTTAPNDPLSIIRAPVIGGLHRQRFAICVLAGIGMIATFMPWVHAPIIGSVSGAAGDGWITLILLTFPVVFAWRGEKLAPIMGNARLGTAITAGLVCLVGLYKVADFNYRMSDIDQDNLFAVALVGMAHIGIGLYVLIAASAALVAIAWYFGKPSIDLHKLKY